MNHAERDRLREPLIFADFRFLDPVPVVGLKQRYQASAVSGRRSLCLRGITVPEKQLQLAALRGYPFARLASGTFAEDSARRLPHRDHVGVNPGDTPPPPTHTVPVKQAYRKHTTFYTVKLLSELISLHPVEQEHGVDLCSIPVAYSQDTGVE